MASDQDPNDVAEVVPDASGEDIPGLVDVSDQQVAADWAAGGTAEPPGMMIDSRETAAEAD